MTVPFVGFSGETLAALPSVKSGESFTCGECGEQHTLYAPGAEQPMSGIEGTLFFRCKDKDYLGAVGGKLIVGLRGDVSDRNQSNVHAVCDFCWNKLHPGREAVRAATRKTVCCWCGFSTASGIFLFSKNAPKCEGHE